MTGIIYGDAMRSYFDNDCFKCLKLLNKIFATTEPYKKFLGDNLDLYAVRSHFNNGMIFLYLVDDEIVAMTFFKEYSRKDLSEISYVCTIRSGYARKLLEFILHEYPRHNHYINLEVMEDNKKAIQLYESLDFQITDYDPDADDCPTGVYTMYYKGFEPDDI